ncbi:MFS transporter [Natronobiforma cellulositropha]|uniref:MFS transporter n=1 Tax=Natronobiforma cellulositropha TaxID=1679076 RepID=UPI0021D599F8|nr:MFS transporter [Natronobiforma cellulositropha]
MSTPTIRRHLRALDALLLTASIWFLAKFIRYAFPPLFEPLQGSYEVSNTIIGAAFTGFMLVYALMQFPSGVLADRLGSVVVITAGAVVAAGASLLVATEPPFALLVLAMALMGAGTGAHKTVAVKLLSRAYPTRTGRALGVLDTIGAFGGVAAPAAVVVVALVPVVLEPGWRTIFLAAALVGLVLAVTFSRRVSRRLPAESRDGRRASGGADDETGLQSYLVLFGEWRFTTFVLATVLFALAYNGAVAFVPLYLTDEAGLTTASASLLYSALFLVSFVQLVTGDVSDRVGTLPVIVCTLLLATAGLVCFILLTASANPFALGAAVVALGLGAHGFRPVRGSYLMAVLPSSTAGGSLGIVRTLLMGAGALAPVTVGYLSETVGFQPAFWLLACSMAGAALLAVVLWLVGPTPDPRARTSER